MVWGCLVGLIVLAVAIAIYSLKPFVDERWISLLPIFLIALYQVIMSLTMWFKLRPDGSRKLPRPRKGTGWRALLWQLALCLFLWSELTKWSWADVGVKHAVHPALAFVIGFVCYLLYSKLAQWIARALFGEAEYRDKAFNSIRNLWPSSARDKCHFWVAICLLNPIAEEIIYRGFLIFALGVLLDNFLLAGVIGISLGIAAHIYQGTFNLPFHLGFALLACGLMFSPLGLVASIGFHFAGDIIPVSSIRSEWKAWLRRNRRPPIDISTSG